MRMGNEGEKNTIEDVEQFLEERKAQLRRKNDEIGEQINSLDEKLNTVLSQQEFEYLKSYNIYVKRKEKDLRDLIEKLNNQNNSNSHKDEKIITLEKTIAIYRDDQIKMEREKQEQVKQIKKWESRSNNFEQERDFLHQ